MIDLKKIKSIYFLGIGGIGMSAIARYFHQCGISVSGYDKTSTPLTSQMIDEGMNIEFSMDVTLLPENPDLVIYTPAIPSDHPAFQVFKSKGIPIKKRAEILGLISSFGKTIAVAGTHGKTTTSTLIAHIFNCAEFNFQAFLGGISKNYDSNFITSSINNSLEVIPEFVVVEADEYDKSFLHLHPYSALITSTDADHLDIYGGVAEMKSTFIEFSSQVIPEGSLVIKNGLGIAPSKTPSPVIFSYAVSGTADFHASDIRVERGNYIFDLITPEKEIKNLSVGIPGRFNLENAIGAAAIAICCGVSETSIREALSTYRGVNRRFDFHIKREDFVYMDDYAHHPEELKACISAVKEIYPTKRITGIFQPHLYSRTKDLAEGFAQSLDLLDEIILLDIYPAREKPIPGVSSELILNMITKYDKVILKKGELLNHLLTRKPEVLLTLGAGDIDQMIDPIVNTFKAPSI